MAGAGTEGDGFVHVERGGHFGKFDGLRYYGEEGSSVEVEEDGRGVVQGGGEDGGHGEVRVEELIGEFVADVGVVIFGSLEGLMKGNEVELDAFLTCLMLGKVEWV